MLCGAIFGDIAGSTHEFVGVKTFGDYPLVEKESSFTDDTICTIAVADWLLREGSSLKDVMREWCLKYPFPMGGYGARFAQWVTGNSDAPYNSFGNGSAMRVSPVGWAFDNVEDVRSNARQTALITHNHDEGIKGAEVIALSIFWLRKGYSKEYVREEIRYQYAYNLNMSVDEIHKNNYRQKESCMETVPEAIISFLDSTCFEDCLRNAFWCNKDTDTVGAIAGSLAEAYYGVTDEVKSVVHAKLDSSLRNVLVEFETKCGQ